MKYPFQWHHFIIYIYVCVCRISMIYDQKTWLKPPTSEHMNAFLGFFHVTLWA